MHIEKPQINKAGRYNMKILFVNKYAGDIGGVERYINALSSRLRDMGHNTALIHADQLPGKREFDEYYSVKILWEKELSLTKTTEKVLDDILGEYCPDIVYLHNIDNREAVEKFKECARTFWYIHGYKAVDPDGKMLLYDPVETSSYGLSPMCFVRAYTRKSMPRHPLKAIRSYSRAKRALSELKRTDSVIVASSHMRRILVRNGIREDKIKVIPYFVHYKDPGDASPAKSGHMLYSGRIAEGKGLDVLIEVLGVLEGDVFLDVAGTGPEEDLVRQKARQIGLEDRVIFHGWKSHEELAELYRTCCFLVVPSVWPEPFGICGIEAAFFGKPAVAFNVGGISEWLIDGETGFLVEPYNKAKMADRIMALLADDDLRRRMGKRARELALEKYSPEKHIERLLTIFKRAIADNQYTSNQDINNQ